MLTVVVTQLGDVSKKEWESEDGPALKNHP
jgi:hypothetical protein